MRYSEILVENQSFSGFCYWHLHLQWSLQWQCHVGHSKNTLIDWLIDWKSPILTYPTCIWCPRWGDPVGISLNDILASEYCGLSCGVGLWWTDGHNDSIYCASIASCSKKVLCYKRGFHRIFQQKCSPYNQWGRLQWLPLKYFHL